MGLRDFLFGSTPPTVPTERDRALIQSATSPRTPIAKIVAGTPNGFTRLYNSAQPSRTMIGFGNGTTSGDGESSSSLTTLRNRSRALVRDNSYAKQARRIVVNNVIGQGIGIQGQVMTTRDELATAVNDGIEQCWEEWTEAPSAHTGGVLSFYELERMAMEQVFEAGEIVIRMHPIRRGRSNVPLCLEIIEPERLAENVSNPAVQGQIRMGVEIDGFHRPVAYYIRKNHPGDMRWGALQSDVIERVPANQIFHLGIRDRWPMTRCVPWMHAVIRKMGDIDGYSEAEITAARAAACYMGFVETENEPDDPNTGNVDANGQETIPMEPGLVERLAYGEKMNFLAPNRPNTAIEAFLRYMLREMASGVGVSYESLSKDYSQSNYSSSRLALLDDRDLWRVLQQWWIRSFRRPLHREFMNAAVLSRSIQAVPVSAFMADPKRYEAIKWRLRGWSYVDPAKEIDAYQKAVMAGFTTITDVVAQFGDGRDVEDIVKTRANELKMFEEAGIELSTTVAEVAPPAPPPAAVPPTDGGEDGGAEPKEDDPAASDAEDRGLRVIRR